MIPEEIRSEIVEYLEGTCMPPTAAIDHFELDCDEAEVEDVMLDANYELCPTCGWWCECHERIPDDRYPNSDGMTPDEYCENCRPNPTDNDEDNIS